MHILLYSKTMAKKKIHVWRITEIRKKGYYIGSVEAATAEDAIKVAVKEFGLTAERAKRLVAQQEG
jgi:hypothetical protein